MIVRILTLLLALVAWYAVRGMTESPWCALMGAIAGGFLGGYVFFRWTRHRNFAEDVLLREFPDAEKFVY